MPWRAGHWSFPYRDGLQVHLAHQPAHALTIDLIALLAQGHRHFWPAIEWGLQVLQINPPHQFQI